MTWHVLVEVVNLPIAFGGVLRPTWRSRITVKTLCFSVHQHPEKLLTSSYNHHTAVTQLLVTSSNALVTSSDAFVTSSDALVTSTWQMKKRLQSNGRL